MIQAAKATINNIDPAPWARASEAAFPPSESRAAGGKAKKWSILLNLIRSYGADTSLQPNRLNNIFCRTVASSSEIDQPLKILFLVIVFPCLSRKA